MEDEFLDRLFRGEAPPLASFLAEHPELSADAVERLEKLVRVFGGTQPASAPELPFHTLGDYRLIAQLGQGGMGTVYLAEQRSLGRQVALKLLRPELAASAQSIARFEREARAVAKLHHERIVDVYEAGHENGVSFLAMEFVPGEGLDEVLAAVRRHERKLSTREIVAIARDIARALACAHAAGIVHRDVKPSNIRVLPDGRAKLLDFGLAFDVDSASLSRTGQFHGTLHYVSPEQIGGHGRELDGRSDIWSLGATLYECVTGRVPFDGANAQSILLQVATHEPVAPRKLAPDLPRDVETVISKALEKDRHRRYANAEELADDLDAILEMRPIRARPTNAATRAWKWSRRKPASAAALGLGAVLLVGGPLGYALFAQHANATLRAEKERTEWRAYAAQISAADASLRAFDVANARSSLEQAQVAQRGWEWRHLASRLDGSIAKFEGHHDVVYSLAVQPGERLLASGSYDRQIKLWDLRTEREAGTLLGHTGFVMCLAFSPDGAILASGGLDHTIRLWDVECQRELAVLPVSEAEIHSLAFSPDGRALASGGSDKVVRIWKDELSRTFSAAFGCEPGETAPPDVPARIDVECVARGHPEFVREIAFAPDGECFASSSHAGTIRTWDMHTLRPGWSLETPGAAVNSIAWSPDGREFVSTNWTGWITVRDALSGAASRSIRAHLVNSCAVFSPDGRWIVSASVDRTVRVFDARTLEQLAVHLGHTGYVVRVLVSRDGSRLWSASSDGTVRVWDTLRDNNPSFAGPPHSVESIAVSPDEHWLVAGHSVDAPRRSNALVVWDLLRDRALGVLHADGPAINTVDLSSCALSPDGKWLAVPTADFAIRVWDAGAITALVENGGLPVEMPEPVRKLVGHQGRIIRVAFTHDSRKLVSASYRGAQLRVWDVASGALLRTIQGIPELSWDIAISPDDARIAVVGQKESDVRVLDLATGACVSVLRGHSSHVSSVAFGARGDVIATGAFDHTVRLWDAATSTERLRCSGDAGEIRSIALSPDGLRVAAGDGEGAIHLWDTLTGYKVAVLHGHLAPVMALAFSRDGATLYSSSRDNTVRTWRTERARPR